MATTYFFTGAAATPFTTAVRQGGAQVTSPLGAREPTARVIRQRYMQLHSAYQTPAPNTVCPFWEEGTARPAYFVEDSPRENIGGGLCVFTRTWATVPTQIIEYTSQVVQLPALAAWISEETGGTSPSYQHNAIKPFLASESANTACQIRVYTDFFLIPGDYEDAGDIPVVSETLYTGANIVASGAGPFTSAEFAELASVAQNIGYFSGAILAPSDLTPSGSAATDSDTATQLSGWYNLGASTVQRWLGNIWMRVRSEVYVDT